MFYDFNRDNAAFLLEGQPRRHVGVVVKARHDDLVAGFEGLPDGAADGDTGRAVRRVARFCAPAAFRARAVRAGFPSAGTRPRPRRRTSKAGPW